MPYWLENLLDSPVALGAIAAVVLILLLWVLLRRQPRSFRAFESESGEVMVTRKAVRELVQRCCEDLGEVGSAQARIEIRRGELHVQVGLRIRRNANLKGISGYLREQINQALTENLSIEKIGAIEIVVVGILEEPKPAV